jgi:hypothetical protein
VVTQVQQQVCMHVCSRCMLHCPHAFDRGTRPSDLVSGTCNTKRLGRAGRRKRRIVEVDGHAQARSRRRPRCFLTCQASAHRCGERGDMRMSMGRAVYDDRISPDDLLQLPSGRVGRLSSNLHRHTTAVMVGSMDMCVRIWMNLPSPVFQACGAVRGRALLPCELTSSCLCVERVMRKVHAEDSAYLGTSAAQPAVRAAISTPRGADHSPSRAMRTRRLCWPRSNNRFLCGKEYLS